MIYIIIAVVLFGIIYYLSRPDTAIKPTEPLKFKPSDYRYTVYKSPRNVQPRQIYPISEGNEIDVLGYEIYTHYTDTLDTIDILIRDNQTRVLMQIVKDGDTESMIGVCDPEVGHIGYLMFEIVDL